MNHEPLMASDLKTSEVVTVPPTMPVASLARLLAERGISSAPVTAPDGALLGIVTEADLLRRLAGANDAPIGWVRNLFRKTDSQANSYARTHGMVAQDVMTRNVISVGPDSTAEHCAQLMEEHGIKRLPVITDGRLVGVVSRADLLKAMLEPPARIGTSNATDAAIRIALREEIRKQPWAGSLYAVNRVEEGVVTLYGYVRSDSIRRGLCVLAGRIAGVVRVDDQMIDAPPFLPGEFI